MMHARIGALLAVVAALLLPTACNVAAGSGRAATETREVSGFSKINLDGSGEVTIEQTGTESLTIEADDNVLPNLTSDVDGGTLKLSTKPGTSVNSRTPIRYRVTVKDLSEVILSGSGGIAASKLEVPELRVDISGSGTVTAAGSTISQDVTLSGSGTYAAADFTSEAAKVQLSGSGAVTVSVNADLEVDISGSGTVTYSGDATVKQSISGSGELVKK